METAVAEVVATLGGKRSREQIQTYPAPYYVRSVGCGKRGRKVAGIQSPNDSAGGRIVETGRCGRFCQKLEAANATAGRWMVENGRRERV